MQAETHTHHDVSSEVLELAKAAHREARKTLRDAQHKYEMSYIGDENDPEAIKRLSEAVKTAKHQVLQRWCEAVYTQGLDEPL